MKLTKTKLKQIIKEEFGKVLSERRIGLGKMSCEDTWKSYQDMVSRYRGPSGEPAPGGIEAEIQELEADLRECPEYSEQLAGGGEAPSSHGPDTTRHLVKHFGAAGFSEE